MARPRNRVVNVQVSSSELRNRSARAKGYRSYYDYRAHDNGRIPPGQPRLRGEGLARARGHRSLSDFLRAGNREGTLVFTDQKGPRNKKGQYQWVDLKVVDPSGRERVFRLRGEQASRKNLKRAVSELQSSGAVIAAGPYSIYELVH
jgi:hypothetical protein